MDDVFIVREFIVQHIADVIGQAAQRSLDPADTGWRVFVFIDQVRLKCDQIPLRHIHKKLIIAVLKEVYKEDIKIIVISSACLIASLHGVQILQKVLLQAHVFWIDLSEQLITRDIVLDRFSAHQITSMRSGRADGGGYPARPRQAFPLTVILPPEPECPAHH